MARVYVRKFDHDEARARYANGESVRALALEYGVVYNAVRLVVVPGAREQQAKSYAAWVRKGRCDDCGGPMSQHSRSLGSTRCKECADRVRATSVSDDALRCITCSEWKQDTEFPRNAAGRKLRRGRASQCRSCQTLAKRDYRRRNRDKANAYDREYKRRRAQERAQAA